MDVRKVFSENLDFFFLNSKSVVKSSILVSLVFNSIFIYGIYYYLEKLVININIVTYFFLVPCFIAILSNVVSLFFKSKIIYTLLAPIPLLQMLFNFLIVIVMIIFVEGMFPFNFIWYMVFLITITIISIINRWMFFTSQLHNFNNTKKSFDYDWLAENSGLIFKIILPIVICAEIILQLIVGFGFLKIILITIITPVLFIYGAAYGIILYLIKAYYFLNYRIIFNEEFIDKVDVRG